MMKKLLVSGFSMMLLALCAWGQSGVLRGKVTDESGAPLVSASVIVKGTTSGVLTGADGSYSIELSQGQTVGFSYIGMVGRDVLYNGQATLDVIMESDEMLDQVVVIGYQTIRKADLTGAVSVVSSEEMNKSSSGTIGNQLQGLATGVSVRSTGRAGDDAFIEIRGAGTFGNRDPLWIIDGMITNPGVDFNPNDIESIQVLKDASTAAIYGSRAANGVIIVTTKGGRKGPIRVNLSARANFEWTPLFDLADAAEYKKYNDIAYDEGIKDGIADVTRRRNHPDYDTDWQNETFRMGKVQSYNASLSGGGESGSYFISGGYYGNRGVSFGNEFDRYSFRVNTTGKKGIFSFGENLSYSYTTKDPLQTNPYNDMMRMMPTIPVYDANNPGGFGYGSPEANTFGVNPIARETLERQDEIQNRISGSLWLELKPWKWISYKINGGINANFWERHWFRGIGNWTQNQSFADTQLTVERRYNYNKLLEHTVNFNHDFGKHHIDGVVGMTYQHQFSENLQGSRLGFPKVGDDWLQVINAGQYSQTANGDIPEEYAMISYLGRANYIYDNKYFFSATLRRDGISRLAPSERWGNFYALALAWRISEEKFFNVPWIDDLKLRANMGRLGNVNIGSWDYVPTVNQTIVTIIGDNIVSGATQTMIANSSLKWETKQTTNVGADMTFLKNRLTVGAEYYVAKSNDVLTDMPIAMSVGSIGAPRANAASLKNSGFELNALWRDRINDFSYSVSANLTTQKNEILDLGYGKSVHYLERTKSEIGHSLGMFYLRKTDGLFRTQADIDGYVNSQGRPIMIEGKRPQLGDVRYIDTNDDATITDADRDIVGNPWPKAQLGLNFTAEWKGFDFNMFWYGQFGNDILNAPRWQGRLFADDSNYLSFKPGEEPYQVNPNSTTPRIIRGDFRNSRWSDVHIEKGSYFRLKNVQLGYTFRKELLSKVGVESLRVYASGSNLLTLTGYSGLDPDFINRDIWQPGVDDFAFPNMRTFMIGIDLSF